MRVMGIDLGIRKYAWSLWEDDTLIDTGAYEVPKSPHRSEELRPVVNQALTTADRLKPDYVYIEETLIGNNRNYSIRLSQTMGAMQFALVRFQPRMVNVQTWKKQVVGSGNAHKNNVRQYIDQKDPAYPALCGDDQDRYDAACIGYYGVLQVTGRTPS